MQDTAVHPSTPGGPCAFPEPDPEDWAWHDAQPSSREDWAAELAPAVDLESLREDLARPTLDELRDLMEPAAG